MIARLLRLRPCAPDRFPVFAAISAVLGRSGMSSLDVELIVEIISGTELNGEAGGGGVEGGGVEDRGVDDGRERG